MEPMNTEGIGFQNKWYSADLTEFKNATVMPVPSAFNDVTASAEVRDHVGWVWYQRSFYGSQRDWNLRQFLRFSSVNYYAKIFLNGKEIGSHIGGHLPFEYEVTNTVVHNTKNLLTVAVNNTLSSSTIPPGTFQYVTRRNEFYNTSDGYIRQMPNFDFFNYAGILRSVYLLKKPSYYIEDVRIQAEKNGMFYYSVISDPPDMDTSFLVIIKDDMEINVFTSTNQSGAGILKDVKPWWPRGMGDPTLYLLEVYLMKDEQVVDVYRLKFGFRTISYSSDQLFINGRAFYCHGFGMHEDFELHGRGYDPVVMTKDLNMLEWMNGNCYRTSHYPYSEERAMEADRRGIAVITETPAVGIAVFTEKNRKLHELMIKEMIARDRNHPSVIMWSLANEPKTDLPAAQPYFESLVNVAKSLDASRPITTVYSTLYDRDKTEPSRPFSEQYQFEVIESCHQVFDILREVHYLAGEMIWNFADFMTGQDITRPLGNHKGVLTRTRQPKMAAYLLRKRYEKLTKEALTASEPAEVYSLWSSSGSLLPLLQVEQQRYRQQ
ncbi:unnamed protein product [Enterobius vermicularis]|uniref:Beta-glucuronidase n=1 Tax=Enterobius vermicularis TaxID=51028 RepID=A0A0N4VLP5_ENTVE|nr:unnamed protein product [Enterobius vermicularis]